MINRIEKTFYKMNRFNENIEIIKKKNKNNYYVNGFEICEIIFNKNNKFTYNINLNNEIYYLYTVSNKMNKNNKTNDEILLFFDEILKNNYNIFIKLAEIIDFEDSENLILIICMYINYNFDNLSSSIFNHISDNCQFELIYYNHKNKKSLFI